MRFGELLRVAELLLDVLAQRLDDLLRAHAVGVDRVGEVAHHRLELHPVRLREQLDDLLALLGVLVGEDALASWCVWSWLAPTPVRRGSRVRARRVSCSAPHRAPSASASSTASPRPSPNVVAAANESPPHRRRRSCPAGRPPCRCPHGRSLPSSARPRRRSSIRTAPAPAGGRRARTPRRGRCSTRPRRRARHRGRRQRARGRAQEPRLSRLLEDAVAAGYEEDGVGRFEDVPGQRVVEAGHELLPDHRDRALALAVQVDPSAAGRSNRLQRER